MKGLIFLVFFICSTSLIAQDYEKAFGLRAGFIPGYTLKKFAGNEQAFEVVFSNWNGIRITGIKMEHKAIFRDYTDKLFSYTGFGVHLGYHKDFEAFHYISPVEVQTRTDIRNPVTGMDFIWGAEYRLLRYPFAIGVEYRPFFDIFGPNYFDICPWDFGFTIKYTFTRI